jgi:hypothetical protein
MARSRLRELGATTKEGNLSVDPNISGEQEGTNTSSFTSSTFILTTNYGKIDVAGCLVSRAAEGDPIDSIAERPTGGYSRQTADERTSRIRRKS